MMRRTRIGERKGDETHEEENKIVNHSKASEVTVLSPSVLLLQ